MDVRHCDLISLGLDVLDNASILKIKNNKNGSIEVHIPADVMDIVDNGGCLVSWAAGYGLALSRVAEVGFVDVACGVMDMAGDDIGGLVDHSPPMVSGD